MTQKWKVGTYFGIGVYLHWTFLLLLAWVLLFNGGLTSALFLVAVFACVVAHEFGHALMARHYGIATRDITLYPIGGVASLRSLPKRPHEEIAVALAGPAVNVAIAFVLTLFLLITGGLWTASLDSMAGLPLVYLLLANVVLAGFNLIPAFPMDGGRVLRAWLARTHDYATATDKAAKVGRVFAVIFGVIALINTNFFFLILAGFIYHMAGVERRQAFMERDAATFGFPYSGMGFGPRNPQQSRGDEVIDVDVIYTPRSR